MNGLLNMAGNVAKGIGKNGLPAGLGDMAKGFADKAGGVGGAMDMFNKAGGVKGLTDKFNEAGWVKGLTDKFNEAGGVKGLTDKFNEAGGAGLGDMAKGLADNMGGAGLGDMAKGFANNMGAGGAGGAGGAMGMASNLLGGAGNSSGNPACGDPNESVKDLPTLLCSLENKINKTLELEIANNFTSIIESILKNQTAQDAITMTIASAFKPTLDNAIANTAYLNEIVKKEIEPEIEKRLLEFYEEYNTKDEKTKHTAFTSFIDNMKRIQPTVGDVTEAKKSLNLLGGNPYFKGNHTTMKTGSIAKQLKQIIPVDVINKKNKMSGGSRKRRQRRRTYKKRRT